MLSYVIGLPSVLLMAALQSAVLSRLTLLDGGVDLVLLAVIAWGLTGRGEEAMIWGMVGGLSLDLLSGLPFGSTAMRLILVAYLVSFTEGRFWGASFLLPLGVVLLGSLVYHLTGLAVLFLIGAGPDIATATARVVLPSTFLNLTLALPVAQVAAGLHNVLFPPEVKI